MIIEDAHIIVANLATARMASIAAPALRGSRTRTSCTNSAASRTDQWHSEEDLIVNSSHQARAIGRPRIIGCPWSTGRSADRELPWRRAAFSGFAESSRETSSSAVNHGLFPELLPSLIE